MVPGFRFVWLGRVTVLAVAALGAAAGCGSRTEILLGDPDPPDPPEPKKPPEPCMEGETATCGKNVGVCRPGIMTCHDTIYGPCMGSIEPTSEACNGIDEDCDGTIDNGFHLDEACDGPDTDLCLDDTMTCNGCTPGLNDLETCNGRDDDCDGIVDADCEVGSCRPTLVVTGSTPSSPSCVDFPVEATSRGVIEYPCGGGAVRAQLGSVEFAGSVENNHVLLTGVVIIGSDRSPDGCVWQTNHAIEGDVGSGALTYSYGEMYIQGTNCWSPCTETGTIQIQWVEGP